MPVLDTHAGNALLYVFSLILLVVLAQKVAFYQLISARILKASPASLTDSEKNMYRR